MDTLSIGANIKKYRTEKGISQEKLAEMIDVSCNYVSILERGEKTPSLPTLVSLANSLGVSADMLLYGVLDEKYEIHGSLLLDRINALPKKERDRIFAVVETMIEMAK